MTAFALTWLEDEGPDDLRRWALAAAVVVGVHVSLIVGYLFWHHFHPSDIGDNSVVAVELAPIDSVADADQTDVAPAPEETVEQKETPTEVPKPPDEPKVEEPPPPPNETTADVAPPEQKPPEKIEEPKPPAPRTAARVRGGAPRVEPSWEAGLVRHLQQYKRYPSEAQSRGEQGVVILGFQRRPQRPRAFASYRAQFGPSRPRRRGHGHDRTSAAAAGLPAQHGANQTRPHRPNPIFPALKIATCSARRRAEQVISALHRSSRVSPPPPRCGGLVVRF